MSRPVYRIPTAGAWTVPAAARGCSTEKEKLQEETRYPTLEDAVAQPRHICEFSNEAIAILAMQDDHDAACERLRREIMVVDGISWQEADEKLVDIDKVNDQYNWIGTMPYKIGIGVAIVSGFGAIPMVFELNTALWFNELFVTTDVPEAKDLETVWEVGSWTWNWMEPALGTASFTLLTLQFSRAQMLNLGLKPYTSWLVSKRADRLAARFPQYDKDIVRKFSKTQVG